uniref:Secreted protein n=1 Tax=Glossina brevipalpis TaxID=37001 RepID=A0A1A9W5T1_9MUSC
MSLLSTICVTFAFFADSSQGSLLESRFMLPLLTNDRTPHNNNNTTKVVDRWLKDKRNFINHFVNNLRSIKNPLQLSHRN